MRWKNGKTTFALAGIIFDTWHPGRMCRCHGISQSRGILFAMNTYMTFTVYGENGETALAEATAQIQKLESLWSVTDKESEIYRANHSDGGRGVGK